MMQINSVKSFFSSRRRHTSSLCDWSSDVCSSDLRFPQRTLSELLPVGQVRRRRRRSGCIAEFLALSETDQVATVVFLRVSVVVGGGGGGEIGRASCRERVSRSVCEAIYRKRDAEE